MILHKFSQNLLIVIFLVAISAPLAIMLGTEDQVFSVHEKRRLTSLPELHWDRRLLNEFPGLFSRYFGDHYGLREKLVERSQHLKNKYFKKSPTWMVIRGEQDWLFMNKRGSLRDHIGLEKLDQDTLTMWQQQLMDKRDGLNSQGVDYFFVPIPNKMTLYSEFLPERIRSFAGTTRLDQLLGHLDKQNRFTTYTDLEPVLYNYRKTHSEDLLYFKSDTHWTSLGAFVAYQHIMTALGKRYPQLETALELQDMQRKIILKDGDLANIINVGQQTKEKSFVLVPRQSCANNIDKVIPGFEQPGATEKRKQALPIINGCPGKTLSVVIMHDSFGDYLRPFFSESFRRAVFLQSLENVDLKSLLSEHQPDIFLDIRIERNLNSLMKPAGR